MKVIEERSKIYGDFEDVAKVSQALKATMFTAYESDEPVICEALDMLLHKLARIGSNSNGYKNIDNWRDIAGYAQLVVEWLSKEKPEGTLDNKVVYYVAKDKKFIERNQK